MSSENTSAKARSLMDCATSTSQAPPESTVANRPSQAIHWNFARTAALVVMAVPDCRKAGSATKTTKKTTPTTDIVAAKWMART